MEITVEKLTDEDLVIEGTEEVSCAFGGCDKLAEVKDNRGTWFCSLECANLYYSPIADTDTEKIEDDVEQALRHEEEDILAAEELMNRNYEEDQDKDPFEETSVVRYCYIHKAQVLDYRARCGECEKAIAEAPDDEEEDE